MSRQQQQQGPGSTLEASNASLKDGGESEFSDDGMDAQTINSMHTHHHYMGELGAEAMLRELISATGRLDTTRLTKNLFWYEDTLIEKMFVKQHMTHGPYRVLIYLVLVTLGTFGYGLANRDTPALSIVPIITSAIHLVGSIAETFLLYLKEHSRRNTGYTISSMREMVCCIGFMSYFSMNIFLTYPIGEDCVYMSSDEGRQKGERCPFGYYYPFIFTSAVFPLLVGRPRFFMVLFMTIVLFVGSVSFHEDYNDFTRIMVLLTLFAHCAGCLTLKYVEEQQHRQRFETVLELCARTALLTQRQEELAEFIIRITPFYLQERLASSDELSVEMSSKAVVAVVDVQDISVFITSKLPRKSALDIGCLNAWCVRLAHKLNLHHIVSVGDTSIIVGNLFEETSTTATLNLSSSSFKKDTMSSRPLPSSSASNRSGHGGSGNQSTKPTNNTMQEVYLDQPITCAILLGLQLKNQTKLKLRCGVSQGGLLGMPMGTACIRYDIFGPALSSAQRLCATCNDRTVHLDAKTYKRGVLNEQRSMLQIVGGGKFDGNNRDMASSRRVPTFKTDEPLNNNASPLENSGSGLRHPQQQQRPPLSHQLPSPKDLHPLPMSSPQAATTKGVDGSGGDSRRESLSEANQSAISISHLAGAVEPSQASSPHHHQQQTSVHVIGAEFVEPHILRQQVQAKLGTTAGGSQNSTTKTVVAPIVTSMPSIRPGGADQSSPPTNNTPASPLSGPESVSEFIAAGEQSSAHPLSEGGTSTDPSTQGGFAGVGPQSSTLIDVLAQQNPFKESNDNENFDGIAELSVSDDDQQNALYDTKLTDLHKRITKKSMKIAAKSRHQPRAATAVYNSSISSSVASGDRNGEGSEAESELVVGYVRELVAEPSCCNCCMEEFTEEATEKIFQRFKRSIDCSPFTLVSVLYAVEGALLTISAGYARKDSIDTPLLVGLVCMSIGSFLCGGAAAAYRLTLKKRKRMIPTEAVRSGSLSKSMSTVDSASGPRSESSLGETRSTIAPHTGVKPAHTFISAAGLALLLLGANFTRPSAVGDSTAYIVYPISMLVVFFGATQRQTLLIQGVLDVIFVVMMITFNPILMRVTMILFPLVVANHMNLGLHRDKFVRKLFLEEQRSQVAFARVRADQQVREGILEAIIPRQLLSSVLSAPSGPSQVRVAGNNTAPNPFQKLSQSRIDAWDGGDCVVIYLTIHDEWVRTGGASSVGALFSPTAAGTAAIPISSNNSYSAGPAYTASRVLDSTPVAPFDGSMSNSHADSSNTTHDTRSSRELQPSTNPFRALMLGSHDGMSQSGSGVLHPTTQNSQKLSGSVVNTSTSGTHKTQSTFFKHPEEWQAHVENTTGRIEEIVRRATHQKMDVVKVFGGTMTIAGPLTQQLTRIAEGNYTDEELAQKQKEFMIEIAKGSLRAVSDAMEIIEGCFEAGLHFTAGIAVDSVVNVLRLGAYPSYEMFGTAVTVSKALAMEAPVQGMTVATEKFIKLFESECEPRPALEVCPAESWRIRGVGATRVRRIKQNVDAPLSLPPVVKGSSVSSASTYAAYSSQTVSGN